MQNKFITHSISGSMDGKSCDLNMEHNGIGPCPTYRSTIELNCKEKMAVCCCVSEARQSSPDISEKSRTVPFKKPDDHFYESISPCAILKRNNSPVVTPSFKVSRGTQVNCVRKPLLGALDQSKTPPLPAKTAIVRPQKPLPPPVPPKPANIGSGSPAKGKSSGSPKPALPPKPQFKGVTKSPINNLSKNQSPPATCEQQHQDLAKEDVISATSPDRPPRNRTNLSPSSSFNTTNIHTGQKSKLVLNFDVKATSNSKRSLQDRKSSSLGRLEALRCALDIQNLTAANEKSSQRDSGFISCSLECVDQISKPSGASIPVAPPRRRRRSVDNFRDILSEPIYAVVDFSKKINRKSVNETDRKVSPIIEKINKDKCTTELISVAKESLISDDTTATNIASNQTVTMGNGDYQPSEHLSGDSSKCSLTSHLEVIVEISSGSSEKQFTSEDSSSDTDISASNTSGNAPNWNYAVVESATVEQLNIPQEIPAAVETDMNSDIQSIETSFATITSLIESLTNNSLRNSQQIERNSHLKSQENEPQQVQPPKISDTNEAATITRLVVSGAVVKSADISPLSEESPITEDAQKRTNCTKEFYGVLEDVLKKNQLSSLVRVFSAVKDKTERESSPASSTTSSSSSDSKDTQCRGRRQQSPYYDGDDLSAGTLGDVDTSDAARQSSVDEDREGDSQLDDDACSKSYSRFSNRNTSGGKSMSRKFAIKRKNIQHRNSSTDSENHQPLSITRPTPPVLSHSSAQFTGFTIQPAAIDDDDKNSEEEKDYTTTENEWNSDKKNGDSSTAITDVPTPTISNTSNLSTSATETLSPQSTSFTSNTSFLEESFDGEQNRLSRTISDSEIDEGTCSISEKRLKKAELTAKEICSSERVFVDCLRLMNVEFRSAVESEATSGGRNPVLPEFEFNNILNYLPQLQLLNEELLHDFELRIKNWSSDPRIADVIIRKGPFLKLYSSYIRNFQSQSTLLDECIEKYPRFGQILKDFEASDKCKKLTLKHYMLKPVQRIPQYKLLLEQYLRNQDETSPDYTNTITALKVVAEVANHANNTMKEGDEFLKLMQLQERLGICDIIEPGRVIIKEGELHKLCRKTLQPRYFILLSDCLLYTSYIGCPSPTCSLKLHNKLPLSRMQVSLPVAQDYDNEFSVISTTRSFTLVSSSAQIRDEWIATLNKAIDEFHKKQSTFSQAKPSAAMATEIKLGQQAPVWVPDSRVTMCQLCTTGFTVTLRRHHCRACGKVVCGSCSSRKAKLEYLQFRSVRVCDNCYVSIAIDGGDMDDEDSTSTRSSTAQDSSTDLLGPFSFINVINSSYSEKIRPSSDPVDQNTTQTALRAQLRRQNVRKEKRYLPQRLIEVSANDTESQHSGYLWRLMRRSWKKNWFVLKDRVLYIYKASEDVAALDTIPVLGYELQHKPSGEMFGVEPELVFQLFHRSQPPILFHAETTVLAEKWIEALSAATVL